MWLITGLGNPGKEYETTRHNIGYKVIDALAERLPASLDRKTRNYIYGRGFIEKEEVILIKPLTFMNRSGIAVREAACRFEGADHLLVIHDDLDLEPGVLRIRRTGSSGGHRGVESIIQFLGSRDFLRLKVGIGRSDKVPSEDYVLTSFNKKEKTAIIQAIERAAEAVLVIVSRGVSKAQNTFHGISKQGTTGTEKSS